MASPRPPHPTSPDWRQHKVIFMNGGGGHEESVTWVLAEAERGMLVHCCCFVVNLVRGYAAARLCWTLFTKFVNLLHRLSRKHTLTVLHTPVHRYLSPQRWGCIFFLIIYFFREDVLTFLSKLLEFSRWHSGARKQACAVHPLRRISFDPSYESSCWFRRFVSFGRTRVVLEIHNTVLQKWRRPPSSRI